MNIEEAIATYQSVLIRDLLDLIPESDRREFMFGVYQRCESLSPTLRRQVYFAVRQDCEEYARKLAESFTSPADK